MSGLLERTQVRIAEAALVLRMLPEVLKVRPGSSWNLAGLVAENAQQHPQRVALAYQLRRFTWSDIDDAVNRAARALVAERVRSGDTVALLMDNRPEYVVAVTALSRIGAVGALINANVTGAALAHAVNISGARLLLVGSEHIDKVEAVDSDLSCIEKQAILVEPDPEGRDDSAGYTDFRERCIQQPGDALEPCPTRVEDVAFYIYTSGTTGLPKAAIVTHQKLLSAAILFARGIFELGEGDVTYVTTPLYHSVGLLAGWGSTALAGSCMALRRRFSASAFWPDVRAFDATVFVYIGELCRYLVNQPPDPRDRVHSLRLAAGNGLRPEIWRVFQERFAIPEIREYYGATEGNSGLINLTGRPGMIGRRFAVHELVRCDPETGEIQRGADGLCKRVEEGETGLLLIRISGTTRFDGYVDAEATRKKVVRNVLRAGDEYFDTGDLLTLHDDGWLAFADRMGDTFRWKGENVSTHEVEEILNTAPGVIEANVYGVRVPGSDGRAGMASLHCGDEFALERFTQHVIENLAGYQRPYFVRLQTTMRITPTLKHQKTDYRREGYDPGRVSDPLYVLDGDAYVPLDADAFAAIQAGGSSVRS